MKTRITLVTALLLSTIAYGMKPAETSGELPADLLDVNKGDFISLAAKLPLTSSSRSIQDLDAQSRAYFIIDLSYPALKAFLKNAPEMSSAVSIKDTDQVKEICKFMCVTTKVRINVDACLLELIKAFRGSWQDYVRARYDQEQKVKYASRENSKKSLA